MESNLTPNKTASAIWSRIAKPEQGNLSPEADRAILKFDCDATDRGDVDMLSANAAEGTLSPDERSVLEESIRVNDEPP